MRDTCEHCNEWGDDVRQRIPGDRNAAAICNDCARRSIETILVPTACGCGVCGPCRNARLLNEAHGRLGWSRWDAEEVAFALLALEESEGADVAHEEDAA